MTVEAYAKVNLTLEVLGRRADGFHEIRSVVQPISLSDTIEVEANSSGVVESDSVYGGDDLAVKAALALRPDPSLGASLRLVKRIPAGGGLGGGSADAAAALLALNSLWRLDRTVDELADVGACVGSDVPALVLAQSARRAVLMEGRGERVRFLEEGECPWLSRVSAGWLVLANPGVNSSTAEVYARIVPRPSSGTAECPEMARNDLQRPACELHPEIDAALSDLAAAGAEDVMMSGSGATVFGLAADSESARRIRAEMENRGYATWSVRTL
ncbi:MAG: 4-(cytidine 5'-diphospho)-2-C-methyl-D-erythritol kinase [Kiritimatiellae bacterium]|nr:4-(cytidine 5'-diphospho)-2-C-methyl-D-erythritol kinase [Kiritimatiellia bacterium]